MGQRLDLLLRGGADMTEEELPRAAMMTAAPKPSLEARLDRLEADTSAQRTAILQVERKVVMLAGAIALAGIVALAFKIALEMLT